jgi:IstB-like ATP binding protein
VWPPTNSPGVHTPGYTLSPLRGSNERPSHAYLGGKSATEAGRVIRLGEPSEAAGPSRAGDEALAAAILDRLLHKSVVLNIRGRSYRLQDLEKLLK